MHNVIDTTISTKPTIIERMHPIPDSETRIKLDKPVKTSDVFALMPLFSEINGKAHAFTVRATHINFLAKKFENKLDEIHVPKGKRIGFTAVFRPKGPYGMGYGGARSTEVRLRRTRLHWVVTDIVRVTVYPRKRMIFSMVRPNDRSAPVLETDMAS